MGEVVLVTAQEFAKADGVFHAADGLDIRSAPAEETALAAVVRATRCRAVVVGIEPYRGPLYEALPARPTGEWHKCAWPTSPAFFDRQLDNLNRMDKAVAQKQLSQGVRRLQ